jgi:hypothetical protein
MFIRKVATNNSIIGELNENGLFVENKDIDIVKDLLKKYAKDSVLYWDLEDDKFFKPFKKKLEELCFYDFSKKNRQNLLKKSFKRQILIEIVSNDFFTIHTAFNILQRWNRILEVNDNVYTYTYTSFILPQLSYNLQNKKLIGLTYHFDKLSNSIKKEILKEFSEEFVKINSNEYNLRSLPKFIEHMENL